MQNRQILTTLTAAILLSTSAAYAAESTTEYCTVTNTSGANLIKAWIQIISATPINYFKNESVGI